MNWTILWLPSAEAALAEIWAHSSDHGAITQAAHRLDVSLQTDPMNAGESRAGLIRIVIELPLALFCEVDPLRFRVQVFAVWSIRSTGDPE